MFLRKLIRNGISHHIKRKLLPANYANPRLDSTYWSHQSYSSSTNATSPALVDFTNNKIQNYLESLRQEFYALRVNVTNNVETHARIQQLNGIVSILEQQRLLKGNIASKDEIENEKDEDMRQLLKEESEVYTDLLEKTEQQLIEQMLTLTDDEYYPSLIFEVTAGAGGQEAMLFAKVLFDMYTNYFDRQGWQYEIIEEDIIDIGGIRHANIVIEDADAYNYLRYEGGVHRVQRVPATEKSGRIHTSTASIAIIPRPYQAQIQIADKDLKIETKRASGAGGQHVNTTDSAVRVVHLPTGIAVECQTDRSQIKNRELALKRLQAKLMQKQLESSESYKQASRKSQQGNLNRNEKIRTYNYVQDRITDHRIQNGTVHNLQDFLDGNEPLDDLMERVAFEFRKNKLLKTIEDWKVTDEVKK